MKKLFEKEGLKVLSFEPASKGHNGTAKIQWGPGKTQATITTSVQMSGTRIKEWFPKADTETGWVM